MSVESRAELLAAGLETQTIPSLRANFKWTFVGNLTYAFCQWGMLSVLAKAGSTVVVGEFSLGLAISAPVFMFTNLNLRAVQATDARSDFEFADYFTLRVLASFCGLMMVAVIAGFLHYDLTTRLVIILLGFAKAIESLGDVVAGLLQRIERLHQVAISLMIRGSLSLLAFGSVFYWRRSLIAAVLALFGTWAVVFLSYDLWRAHSALGKEDAFFRFHWRRLRRLAAVSVPLGVVMTLVSLSVNVPRYMVAKYLGESDLGIFSSLAYLLVALYLVVNALGESTTARLARMFACNDFDGFRHILLRLVWLGVGILVLAGTLSGLYGRSLLRLIYRQEYSENLTAFVIIILSGGITAIGTFLGYAISATRHFQLQVPAITVSTITTVILTAILAPRLGLVGATLALLAAAAVYVLGNSLALRYALGRGGAT